MKVLGVDGCKGAWVGALLSEGHVEILALANMNAVLAVPDVAIIGIDMPIGLSDDGIRACDEQARKWLKGKGASSSVFPAPVRAVLDAVDYAHARELSVAATGGRSLSAQSFFLTKAIKSVDDALGDPPLERIFEVHPEMAFRTIDDRVRDSKTSGSGLAQRLRALATVMNITDALADAPKVLPAIDVLDACAAAWSAQRIAEGTNECVGDGSLDDRLRPMRICW